MRGWTVEDLEAMRWMQRDSLTVSPDGRWLAIPTQSVPRFPYWLTPGDGAALLILDIQADPPTPVLDIERAWNPSWSPHETHLAFLLNDHEGTRLHVWTPSHGVRMMCEERVHDYWNYTTEPRWATERLIYLMVAAREDRAEGAGVTARVLDDLPRYLLRPRRDPAVIDLTSGTVTRLSAAVPVDAVYPAPGGNHVAILTNPLQEHMTERPIHELHLGSSELADLGLLTTLPFEATSQPLAWSPDGTSLAVIVEGRLTIFRCADRSRHVISWDAPLLSQPFYWTCEGDAVIAYDAKTLVHLPLAGRPRALRTGPVVRRTPPIACTEDGMLLGTNTMHVKGSRPDASAAPVAGPRHGSVWLRRVPLVDNDRFGGLVAEIPDDAFIQDATADGRVLVAISTASGKPDERIRVLDLSGSVKDLPSLNPHLDELVRPRVERIPFRAAGGAELEGLLLVPPEDRREAPGPVPVVVAIYPDSAPSNEWFVPTTGVIFPHMLVSHGYGVFHAPLPVAAWGWAQRSDLTNALPPAVDALIANDLVDGERLALLGHSAGATAVNLAITQHHFFRAAVSASGLCDLVLSGTAAADADLRVPLVWTKIVEAMTGGPPWSVPERFVEESALYSLDRVTTPLLLIHGSDDSIREDHSIAMYLGLQRAGKKVRLARYIGEGHGPCDFSPANRRHVAQLVLDWLNEHV